MGVRAACEALRVVRDTFHRRRRPKTGRPPPSAPALDAAERAEVVGRGGRAPHFADRAPPALSATLPNEGTRLCSQRAMYQILAERGGGGHQPPPGTRDVAVLPPPRDPGHLQSTIRRVHYTESTSPSMSLAGSAVGGGFRREERRWTHIEGGQVCV